MLLLLLSATAWAYTPAGFGVPELGGTFAGVSEDGALGIIFNPAAAHPERGEYLLDVGWIYSELVYRLDEVEGGEGYSLGSSGATLAPALGLTEPIGPVGIGFSFAPWMARGGGDGAPADGGQRFHTVKGKLQVLESTLSVAVPVHQAWTLGVGGRYVMVSLGSERAVDAGALIGSLTPPDTDVPIGDPFLEGYQALDDHSGWGVGVVGGVQYKPQQGPGFSLAVRSPINAQVEGAISVVPSNYLDMELQAEGDTLLPLPGAAFLSFDIPVGRVRVVTDIWWVNWGRYYSFATELSDMEIVSDDAVMQDLLESYELTEAEFLEGVSGAESKTGMHDTVSLGASAFVPVGEQWQLRFGVWYHPSAVPEETVHPGNLDFAAVDLRAATKWDVQPWMAIALGGDLFLSPQRRIDDSQHSLVDPEPPGALLPSGNGTYKVFIGRVGLSAIFSHRAFLSK